MKLTPEDIYSYIQDNQKAILSHLSEAEFSYQERRRLVCTKAEEDECDENANSAYLIYTFLQDNL